MIKDIAGRTFCGISVTCFEFGYGVFKSLVSSFYYSLSLWVIGDASDMFDLKLMAEVLECL